MVRIDDEKEYIRRIELAVLSAGRQITKQKLHGAFIFLKHKEIDNLVKKYFNGRKIRQASFHDETNLEEYEIRILDVMKVILNKKHIFIYERNIVEKIKARDLSIVAIYKKKPKYKIVGGT